MFYDLKLSRSSKDWRIAVGLTASAQPFSDISDHSTTDLLAEVLEEQRPHEAAHADLYLILHALVRRDDVDFAEAQEFRDLVQVAGISADAINAFDHNGIEAPVTGCLEELSQADSTDEGLGRHGTIFENPDLAVALASQVASAELHLICNGAVRLERGRVSGIDCGTALHS